VAGKVAILLWFAWQNRNNKVWHDSSIQAQQIGTQASSYWQQWAAVHGLLIDQQQPAHGATAAAPATCWQQPPPGYFKCNVDASFYNMAGATGWGWVIRDSRGYFKLAGSNTLPSSLKC
jgi:hypothetical protein